MVTIIHGDNIKDSREYYFNLKQASQSSKTLIGDKMSMTDLVEAVEGQDLFESITDVFIETMLFKKQPGKELDAYITYLNKVKKAKIVLWEQKLLDKKVLKKFSQANIKEFSYPKTLFQFLDALQPHNGKTLISLFQKTLQTLEPEMIFFMLTKQIRMMLTVKDSAKISISEIQYMQPWQKKKLEHQASLFSLQQLEILHSKLFDLDWRYKTGNTAFPLKESLDFLFLEI